MKQIEHSLGALPKPAKKAIALRVRPAAERALRGGHPWLFAEGIQSQSRAGQSGDLAVVFDRKGRFLAVGLYDPASPIRVRVLQHGEPAQIDGTWFAARLAKAIAVRKPLEEPSTTGYRLVHGENDGLPGLVIDRYASTLVMMLYTAAWFPWLGAVLAALQEVTSTERLVLRLSRHVQRQDAVAGLPADGAVLLGSALHGPVRFQESGLTFEAEVRAGQKTGFFLDQRENRARVEALASGRTVLNVFAFNGGFSVYAARGGAQHVVSLDIDRRALAAAKQHFQLNTHFPGVAAAAHETIAGDGFEVLPALAAEGNRYSMVVLDPPAFATSRATVPNGLHAYERLIHLGLALLQPQGVLVAASCSSRVAAEVYFDLVGRVVRREGRSMREIARTGHALDHPVAFAEGAYLKALFARIV